MRMTAAVAVGVLILEALLAGAFLLGFYWLGGWRWGLLFSGVFLLLLLLPWLGELKLVFDSTGPRGAARIGWWGRVSFAQRESATDLVVRILGIPMRRSLERKQAREKKADREEREPPPEFEPAAMEGVAEEHAREAAESPTKPARQKVAIWQRIDSETIEGLCRVIGSGLGASCELIWGAEEIRVSVQDPTKNAMVDSTIEQVFGRRQVGPADVSVVTGESGRRVRAVYRIGLLRMVLASAQVVIDGRVLQLARRMKQKRAETAPVDENQRIIDEIVEQEASRREDEQ